MRFAVVTFPGSNCDDDCVRVLREVLGFEVVRVWFADRDLTGAEVVILPGGFSYGDYLRCGAMAARAPIMEAVRAFAAAGGPVLGICNGFQILTEAGMLPGALLRNRDLHFICEDAWLAVEGRGTPFTGGLQGRAGLMMPIAHHGGSYFVDPQTLARLEGEGQIVLRYCEPGGAITERANPNGSVANIAGICNGAGNVVGLMPHPERASEPLLGGTDGRLLFEAFR